MTRKQESGQALVLVLLSLAVVLTLVLFILARSVTDVAVSTSQEDSVRAFSAAEAGIENALVIGKEGSANGSNYTANVSGYSEGSSDFPYPAPLLSGDSATTWFVAHDPTSENIVCDQTHPCFSGSFMKVCWGNVGTYPNPQFIPAIEVSVYYETSPGDASTAQIARAVFDPNSARLSSNSFASPDPGTCQIGGTNYEFQKTIQFGSTGLNIPDTSYNFSNGLLFARIRMFYNTDVG